MTSAVQVGEEEVWGGLMVTGGGPMLLSQLGYKKCIPRAAGDCVGPGHFLLEQHP